MSVDKFGRHSSGQIYTEPGVSVRYINNNFIRRDGSNEVEGDLSMNTHKITNLAEPINFRDAVIKRYVDRQKPIITIWACHEGPLHTNALYEWSFGGGFAPSDFGYPMPTSGMILRIVASSKQSHTPIWDVAHSEPIYVPRIPDSNERPVRVIIVINGNDIGPHGIISVHPGSYSGWRLFPQPI